MKKRFGKKALSDVISTLLILLLVFVAVAILWVVIRNVINQGSEQVTLGKFTLDLKIDQVSVDEIANQVSVRVKRNTGDGEFVGLKIIVSDDENSDIFNFNGSLDVYEKKDFQFNLVQVNSSNIKKIQVAPIFRLSSGKEVVGDVKDTWESSEGISNFDDDEEIILPPANQTGGECTVDSNCTADNYSPNYCHASGDVYRNYFDFYCNATQQCTYTTAPQIVQDCNSTQTCSGAVCVNNAVTPTCTDGIQNGGETGIDCGGSCPACSSPPTGNCIHYNGACGSGCTALTDYDCFANEHSGWVLFTLKDENSYSNKIYIDPTWTGCESGTISCPYNSWTDVSWQSNTAYLQKRGTSQTTNAQFSIPSSVSNIYIGPYGIGARPILIGTNSGTFFNIESQNTLFRDIHIQHPGASFLSGIALYFRGNALNCVLYNVTVSNSGNDAVFSWGDGLKVLYSEIKEVYVDAIWAGNSENVEIAHNYIHHVNLMWFDYGSDTSQAGGDGIQFSGEGQGVDKWWVHHNVVDRTNSGNKGCLHASGHEMNYGIAEYNSLSGPLTIGHGGAAFYIPYNYNTHIIFRNNVINGPVPYAIYSETNNLLIENNTIKNPQKGIFSASKSTGVRIINNNLSGVAEECFIGSYSEKSGNIGCPELI